MPGYENGEKKARLDDPAITKPNTLRIARFLTAPGAFGSIAIMLAEIPTVESAASADNTPKRSKTPERNIESGIAIENPA